ncbi:MAG: DNA repair protein RecN [Candidatus Muproteobacteria bacterium RBG_16_62_13]|uniref:DNA repair protein RecN n=1 Tax=Candidatus Muproteobacteria bacterium RBG_16_62_13 TaxID=1817756 RepID=A0A1F6T3L6_9PROT|nr:MAG: DNA repair protein RecN [Candidatus Muproteobacteria bacterium RBG_16_62_13]
MLDHLFVRDFVIVRSLELEFGPGLTVLTGETGAGKSIVIDALALALGERAEAHVIRAGAARAEVNARFALSAGSEAAAWLKEQELSDEGECLLRRVVERDKPSRAWINGRPATVQQLRDLGDRLVDIHGQHEHQSLLKRDHQLALLDAYAGIEETVDTLAGHYANWKSLHDRLQTLKQESADRDQRLEWLRHQVRELEALKLSVDEIPKLEEEHARLANGAELLQGVQDVAQVLYDAEDNAVSALLSKAGGQLEALTRFDAKLAEVVALLNEAAIQIDEAAARLHQYLDGLDLDPGRLEELDARLGTVHDLARKHRVKPDELPALTERLRVELDDIENYDTNLVKLEDQAKAAAAAYDKLAAEIGKARTKAARKLGAAVGARLPDLGMRDARIEVAITALDAGERSARGRERAEFLVAANPGQPARPLAKVASGGELSRLSLALQVELASLGRIPTLIFDEVDVGVGGRVAEIVGQLLREIGERRQVFVITHLAQVAALGHQHLQVSKRSKAGETETHIEPLTGTERVKEIARMIGGIEISPQTIAHAKDMLSRAHA